MSTINGFGVLPFSFRSPYLQVPAANQAIAQELDPSAAGSSASQAATGTAGVTGFALAPKLSSDVIDALIKSQSESSTGVPSTAPPAVQAISLSGAAALADQPAASSDASSAGQPSGPLTLQQIARQFDPHHLTHQQEEQLQGQLVSSGTISQKDGLNFFTKTVFSDWFHSQHYRNINGQLVATTPSAPGTLIGNDAPGGPTHDVIQRYQLARV
ncbi:MAG TPA: hypothetical protein VKT76_16050 [Bradyrhizobium sp.]|nr:hypothetical protein [Bradyrhizobium sp.]